MSPASGCSPTTQQQQSAGCYCMYCTVSMLFTHLHCVPYIGMPHGRAQMIVSPPRRPSARGRVSGKQGRGKAGRGEGESALSSRGRGARVPFSYSFSPRWIRERERGVQGAACAVFSLTPWPVGVGPAGPDAKIKLATLVHRTIWAGAKEAARECVYEECHFASVAIRGVCLLEIRATHAARAAGAGTRGERGERENEKTRKRESERARDA